jgi:tRNA(Ile)-lysidine synthase
VETDGVSFRGADLRAMPKATANRFLRYALETVRGDLRRIDSTHVEDLHELASTGGAGELHLPGVRAMRSFDQIRLTPAQTLPPVEYCFGVTAPGEYTIPNARRIVLRLWSRSEACRGYNKARNQALDWDRIPKPLRLRNWLPGDCFRPKGHSRARNLKLFFQAGRIARWERADWPLLVGGNSTGGYPETVLWAHRFGPSDDFAADERSERVLEIWEESGAKKDVILSSPSCV